MSRPKEKILVLSPDRGNGFDIGNIANSVATFILPCKLSVIQAQAFSNTAQTANSIITIGPSNTNSAAGSITIPASTSADAVIVDTLAIPYTANAGSKLLVCVTDAGDSGEVAFVKLICEYEPEVVANQSDLTESA